MLQKKKLQIVKEKNKTKGFFCMRIAHCFAQLHIVQHNGKKKFIASHDSFTKTIDYKTFALVLNAVSSKLENETCVGLKLL